MKQLAENAINPLREKIGACCTKGVQSRFKGRANQIYESGLSKNSLNPKIDLPWIQGRVAPWISARGSPFTTKKVFPTIG